MFSVKSKALKGKNGGDIELEKQKKKKKKRKGAETRERERERKRFEDVTLLVLKI
jgi:hypothetical protein